MKGNQTMYSSRLRKIMEIKKIFSQSKPDQIKPLVDAINGEKSGQALVLLAVSFFALFAFIGLLTDVGAIYVAYTQLQRAIDAAAVASANNIKYPQDTPAERKEKIRASAYEILDMHEITGISDSDLDVLLCDDVGIPADFAALCSGSDKRKLVYIKATQQSPVYFLHLFGVQSVPLSTDAIGEAAALDMVLVFDTSESMGKDTIGYNPNNFNPASCNSTNTCQPLRDAKDAAKSLTNNLFSGYDRVAIVSFDYDAQVDFNLNPDMGQVNNAIDNLVQLHDDPPAELLAWTYNADIDKTYPCGRVTFNPIYPDDRDGDGFDADPGLPCTDELINATGLPGKDMWDDNTCAPCDDDNYLDAYDWNNNLDFTDDTTAPLNLNAGAYYYEGTSLLSTCSGCGLRMATNVLKNDARQTAVWVIVFLSDGVANMSDTPYTFSTGIPNGYRYGFCGPAYGGTAFWSTYCIDTNPGTFDPDLGSDGLFENRNCIDTDSSECPPGATHTTASGPYSVDDYALDMIDSAALLVSSNEDEPRGEDIVIYSIGLGAASVGESLLRYMANVGDEGSRLNDECDGIATMEHCGNYYYAPSGAYLSKIFESVAGRIFTKISR